MKTIEEKALAYDKALEKARIWKEKSGMPSNKQGILDDIFPELKEKESEDEKIRKGLLKMFHHYVKNNVELIEYGLEKDKVIAWLEKQGEQKPADKEYTFKAIPRLLEMIEPNDRAKAYCQKLIDSLTQEGYATDARIVGECLKQMNGEKVAMATMDGQKPVEWSERDEERLISCINLLEVQSSIKGNKDTINTKWLKSLKYRVQPRQEWNKEDKDILSSIITRIESLEDFAIMEKKPSETELRTLYGYYLMCRGQP